MFPYSPPIVIDEAHPVWDVALAFHQGLYDHTEKRQLAKAALFLYHYGNYDMSKVYEAAGKTGPEE